MGLEHVPRPAARPEHQAGAGPDDLEDPEPVIEERHGEGEPHADGVDRPRPLEQERSVALEGRTAKEPAGALAPCSRHLRHQPDPAIGLEDLDQHRPNVRRRTDIALWGGQDSNPRHEG